MPTWYVVPHHPHFTSQQGISPSLAVNVSVDLVSSDCPPHSVQGGNLFLCANCVSPSPP